MKYFDGIVVPVPKANRAAALEFSHKVNRPWLDHGALRVVRGWGIEIPEGKATDFRKAVAAKDDEDIVFGWVEWPDKATRDAAMARMQSAAADRGERPTPPFDASRLIFGGFEATFDTAGDTAGDGE